MKVKFYSNRPHLYLAYRQLPGYPITTPKILNSGIDFDVNGEFETEDTLTIKCLRAYINYYGKTCCIWEAGQEAKPLPVVEEPKEEKDRARNLDQELTEEELYAEFLRYLRR